jgi:hypothetical protein
MEMNEDHCPASGRVQRAASRVATEIDWARPTDRQLAIPLQEETTMLKTISAALLAVSVIAAPALAAGKTAKAPVTKTQQVKQIKPTALNANAKMGRHHVRHKHMHALKTQKVSKATIKKAPSLTKRG